jgi:hypothetical protein
VPLSKIQSEVLRLLSAHRDPESYVAGATPLNRDAPRFSAEIYVFHDRQERAAEAALNDGAVLETAGYNVAWLRQLPAIYTAAVTKGDDGTRLEWVVIAISASSRPCGMTSLATFCTRSILR